MFQYVISSRGVHDNRRQATGAQRPRRPCLGVDSLLRPPSAGARTCHWRRHGSATPSSGDSGTPRESLASASGGRYPSCRSRAETRPATRVYVRAQASAPRLADQGRAGSSRSRKQATFQAVGSGINWDPALLNQPDPVSGAVHRAPTICAIACRKIPILPPTLPDGPPVA